MWFRAACDWTAAADRPSVTAHTLTPHGANARRADTSDMVHGPQVLRPGLRFARDTRFRHRAEHVAARELVMSHPQTHFLALTSVNTHQPMSQSQAPL